MKFNADRATIAIVLLCAGFVALSFFRNGSGGSCALIPFESPSNTAPADISAWVLTDLDGKIHQASDYRDRPYVMTFWATWCVNCRQEIPAFTRLHDRLTALGGNLLSVNLDDGPVEPLRDFARAANIDYPVLRADPERPSPMTVRAVPTTLIVAPGGTVLKQQTGKIDLDEILALLSPYLTPVRED